MLSSFVGILLFVIITIAIAFCYIDAHGGWYAWNLRRRQAANERRRQERQVKHDFKLI